MTLSGTQPTIEVADLLRELDAGAPLILIDVRNVEDFAAWRIEARRPVRAAHVPYFDFLEDPEGALARVPRGLPPVAVCAQGGSSALVVELLREHGHEARNLAGGMAAYGAHLAAEAVSYSSNGRIALWQVNRRGKGCLSYVVRAGDEVLVIDPSRAVEWYLNFVAELGARLVRVLDTHVHADHVSGGPELAARLGIPYGVGFGAETIPAAEALRDGQVIEFGSWPESLALEVLETPGHTPGSACFLLEGRYLFTGDTLFVRGVGRPDLGGQPVEWGRALYHSLRRCLARLPERCVVLPAHYAGSEELDDLGLVRGSLDEQRGGPELCALSEEDFVRQVAAAPTPAPEAYAAIVRANLGLAAPAPDEVTRWELGRNQCAASARTKE